MDISDVTTLGLVLSDKYQSKCSTYNPDCVNVFQQCIRNCITYTESPCIQNNTFYIENRGHGIAPNDKCVSDFLKCNKKVKK